MYSYKPMRIKNVLKVLPVFSLLFITSCIGTNYQEVKKKRIEADPCYYEKLSRNKRDIEICEARVRAGNADKEGKKNFMSNILGNNPLNNSGSGTFKGNVNQYLWLGSIETLGAFPIKIADAFGGYIETDWITTADNVNKRCVVKIQITSPDFVSTGVDATMVCQKRDSSGSWIMTSEDFLEESSQIVNAILDNARRKFQNS